MSGGHYEYEYQFKETFESVIADLRSFYNYDESVSGKKITPLLTLAKAYQKLYKALGKQIHELDYHFSGDDEIENPKEWQRQAVKELTEIFEKLSVSQELQEKVDKIQEQIDEL
jgi:hypothetical protein